MRQARETLHHRATESPLARELPGADYRLLKLCTKDLLAKAGNSRRAAEHTRVEQPRLDAYANPAKDHEFMPVDVVADLEADIGAPVLTAALAELTGHALVPLPAFDPARTDIDALLAAARTSAEAVAEAWEAHADGVWTDAEVAALGRRGRAAVAAFMAFLARLERGGAQ